VEIVTPSQVGRYNCPINPSKQDVEQVIVLKNMYINIYYAGRIEE
jgi:hypothetical protein